MYQSDMPWIHVYISSATYTQYIIINNGKIVLKLSISHKKRGGDGYMGLSNVAYSPIYPHKRALHGN
jgi:hypothetical protein